MDSEIREILEQNPEFDRIVLVMLELLLKVKLTGKHGKTGCLVEHTPKAFGLIHEIKDHTRMK